MDLVIEKLLATDEKDLFEFELQNRFFFEEMVPIFYLIKDKDGSILGRINLMDIDKSRKIGHLGYRVGRAYAGKGIATKALKKFVEAVTSQGIKQIQAKTTTHNIASQKVLERNKFLKRAISHDEFEMNGQKLSFIYYTLTIKTVIYPKK